MLKSNITDFVLNYSLFILFYSFALKINPDDDLLLDKTINIQNVVILIRSVFHKNHEYYYHETFSEKCSCK